MSIIQGLGQMHVAEMELRTGSNGSSGEGPLQRAESGESSGGNLVKNWGKGEIGK